MTIMTIMTMMINIIVMIKLATYLVPGQYSNRYNCHPLYIRSMPMSEAIPIVLSVIGLGSYFQLTHFCWLFAGVYLITNFLFLTRVNWRLKSSIIGRSKWPFKWSKRFSKYRELTSYIYNIYRCLERRLKPGFHYPRWRPELTARINGPSWRVTGFHYPSTRAALTGARFH